MTQVAELKIFATHPHPCSYLEGQEARTIFVDPATPIDIKLYSHLSEIGFRRSGPHLYRPYCNQCQACIPARIPVDTFKPSRSQKRTTKRNQDLHVDRVDDLLDDEFYLLYATYITERHSDGDMYPPSREQFNTFLTSEWDCTQFYTFRDAYQNLKAVAVVDQMENGLSAVYTFYDPYDNVRSLGVYAVLWQIEQAKQRQLPYVYLGYWIKACRKMSYKTDYKPLQVFINQQWQAHDDETAQT